jgi:hypothetical protein
MRRLAEADKQALSFFAMIVAKVVGVTPMFASIDALR